MRVSAFCTLPSRAVPLTTNPLPGSVSVRQQRDIAGQPTAGGERRRALGGEPGVDASSPPPPPPVLCGRADRRESSRRWESDVRGLVTALAEYLCRTAEAVTRRVYFLVRWSRCGVGVSELVGSESFGAENESHCGSEGRSGRRLWAGWFVCVSAGVTVVCR